MPESNTAKVREGATAEPVRRPRRRHSTQRMLDLAIEVNLESEHNFYTGLTRDIASGGVFVRTARVEPVGTCVRVQLTLAGLPERVDLDAVVRWVRNVGDVEQHGMGLQLVDLPADVRAAIDSFMRSRESLFHDSA